jgi:hypothetical protein
VCQNPIADSRHRTGIAAWQNQDRSRFGFGPARAAVITAGLRQPAQQFAIRIAFNHIDHAHGGQVPCANIGFGVTPITIDGTCARHFSQHVFKSQARFAHKAKGAGDLAGRGPSGLVL